MEWCTTNQDELRSLAGRLQAARRPLEFEVLAIGLGTRWDAGPDQAQASADEPVVGVDSLYELFTSWISWEIGWC